MTIKLLNRESDYEQWDAFALHHPDGNFSHSSSWRKVLEKSFKHLDPLYLTLYNNHGSIRGGLPCFLVKSFLTGKRIISLPFTDGCSPLVSSREDLARLIKHLLALKKEINAAYIELKPQNSTFLEEINTLVPDYHFLNHTLTINKPPEILWKSFHRTCVRQRIQRAEKSNITLKAGTGYEDITTFYELHILTRKKHGLPPFPPSFFNNLFELFSPTQNVLIYLALLNKTPIAGLVVLPFKQTLHIPFSSLHPDFTHYSPTHLLFWELIKFGHANGYQTLDFGRTSPGNSGLLDFKRRWGAEEKTIPYFYYPEVKYKGNRNTLYLKGINAVCQRFPRPLLLKAGEFFFAHLG